MAVLYVICKVISVILGLASTCMFLRFILSFIYMDEGPGFYVFICVITEFFITPVRALLAAFHIGENLPVDLGFFFTYLLLSLTQLLLPVI